MQGLISLFRAPRSGGLPETVEAGPSHIWIEPTNRCNTKCTHCGHFYDKFGQDMGAELYSRIREDVLPGVERAELIGYGEPLMAKHFWEMFDECAARGIEIHTTTNGILLRDDERVGKLVRNNVVLCVSIDGARKETFEFVRPYIKWEQMIETMDCIHRNAEAAGADRRFRLMINFVAMKQNIGDLSEMVRLAARYGAYEINVLPLGGENVFEKMAGQSLDDSPELVSPAYLEALKEARRLNVHLTVPPAFLELLRQGAERRRGLRGRAAYWMRSARLAGAYFRQNGFAKVLKKLEPAPMPPAKAGHTWCSMPWRDAYFGSDGTVFPCCIMGEKLGDLNKQPWREIWNGQGWRNLRRTVHGWNPSGVCRGCALPSGINGGDEKAYDKFFEKFERKTIAMNDAQIQFGGGFHALEEFDDGRPMQRWMERRGSLALPMQKGARFLKLHLIPRQPVPQTNPGRCVISDGEPEPFDNSCPTVHFPLDHIRSDRIDVELEMENSHRVGEDRRELALAIRGVELLFEK